jgi:two-component system cell cycle sensor histidine kinase PleC
MDPQEVSRVCEPFVQLESGLDREQEGAGLGLALVKRFVELHGGTLAFETAPGLGTRVTVTLPQAAMLPAAVLNRVAGS